MNPRLAEAESRRWFWRPALVAAAGALAVVIAIAINVWQGHDMENAGRAPAPGTVPPAADARRPPAAESLPGFDVVRINPQGDTVIAGRAEPGSEVVLRDGDEELGRVTADARGEWVFLPDKPLPPGAHRLNLQMHGSGGSQVASAEEVVVVVPKPGEDIAGRPADGSAQPLVLRVPRDGGPTAVLQKPLTAPAETSFGVDFADWQNGQLALGGHAPPQAKLRITVDGKPAGETVADASGRWRLAPSGGITAEMHTLTLEQLDSRGAVTARSAVPLALKDLATLAAGGRDGGRAIMVQPGSNLWRIARAGYGRGTAYTIIFEANRGKIADPDRIYPGQVFRLPGDVAADAPQQ